MTERPVDHLAMFREGDSRARREAALARLATPAAQQQREERRAARQDRRRERRAVARAMAVPCRERPRRHVLRALRQEFRNRRTGTVTLETVTDVRWRLGFGA